MSRGLKTAASGGDQLMPARDLSEVEARLRLAEECDDRAETWEHRAESALGSYDFAKQQAAKYRERAASLRKGSPQ